jgi:predicted dehydrogenase
MSSHLTRRQFMQTATLAGAGVVLAGPKAFGKPISPNEKLNIGIIGVANRGGDNLAGVRSQNIVALCDIDDNYLGSASTQFPSAKTYNDFRKLLEQKDIDAIVVSTPDHTHAAATMMALKTGHHVYCEKPLAHTVWEARLVADTAKKYKRITQMGTQIHAENNYRRVVELVQSGAIGPVKEVHVWCDKVWSGGDRPTETPPIPSNIHWDLWLGPAHERPFNPVYLPATWRGWWEFGGGTLSDMACHHVDLPTWALKLRYPNTIEAEGPPIKSETTPEWLIVRYEYPAREDMPAVNLTWYNGGKRPPQFAEGKLPRWGDGTLFVGEKGMLLADYGRHVLLPEADFVGFTPPTPFIPNSIGHHLEWIEAIKTGGKTTCNFDYSGALAENVLLGNVAYRSGKKLEWDAKHLKAKNCPEADSYIRTERRKGWEI